MKKISVVAILLCFLVFVQDAQAGRASRIFWTFAIGSASNYLLMYGIDSDHGTWTQKEKIASSAAIGLMFVGLIELAAWRQHAPFTVSDKHLSCGLPREVYTMSGQARGKFSMSAFLKRPLPAGSPGDPRELLPSRNFNKLGIFGRQARHHSLFQQPVPVPAANEGDRLENLNGR